VRIRALAIGAALVVLTCAFWARVRTVEFYQDDFSSLWKVHALGMRGMLAAVVAATRAPSWRPLSSELWFWSNLQAWGARPSAFHIAGLLAFAIEITLGFALARRLLRSDAAAGAVAALWATNPVHSQSLAWCSGIGDILMGVFVLGSLLAHDSWVRGGGRSVAWRVASAMSVALAMLCKEPAAMMPIVVIAYDTWLAEPRARDTRERLQRAAPYLALSLLYGLRFFWAGLPEAGPYHLAPGLLSARNLAAYFGWSFGLLPPAHHAWTARSMIAMALAALAALVVVLASRARWRQQAGLLGFGVLWFGAFIFPVLLVPRQCYAYYASLPSFGPTLAVVTIAFQPGARRAVILLTVVVGMLVAARARALRDTFDWWNGAQNRLPASATRSIQQAGGLAGVTTLYLVGTPVSERWAYDFQWMFRFEWPSIADVTFLDDVRDVPARVWDDPGSAVLTLSQGRAQRLRRTREAR